MHNISMTSNNTPTAPEKILHQLNWNLGASRINYDDFTPIKYTHLTFSRLKPPFNQCSYMQVYLPKVMAFNDEGDFIKYAIVEAGNHHGIQCHATPTMEFAQNTLIPRLNSANIHISEQNSVTTIIHP